MGIRIFGDNTFVGLPDGDTLERNSQGRLVKAPDLFSEYQIQKTRAESGLSPLSKPGFIAEALANTDRIDTQSDVTVTTGAGGQIVLGSQFGLEKIIMCDVSNLFICTGVPGYINVEGTYAHPNGNMNGCVIWDQDEDMLYWSNAGQVIKVPADAPDATPEYTWTASVNDGWYWNCITHLHLFDSKKLLTVDQRSRANLLDADGTHLYGPVDLNPTSGAQKQDYGAVCIDPTNERIFTWMFDNTNTEWVLKEWDMTLTEVQSNNALSGSTSAPPTATYNGTMQMDIWEEDYSYLIVPDPSNAFLKVSTTDLSLIDSYTGFYPCRQGAVIDQKTETYYGFAYENNQMGSCVSTMDGDANNYYGPVFGYHEGLVDIRRGPGQGYVIAIDNEDRFCVIDISSDNLDMDSEPDHAYYYLDGNPGGGGTYTLAESYLSLGTVLSTTQTLDFLPSTVEAYIDAEVTANTDVVLTISDGTNSIQISHSDSGQEIEASVLTSTDITVEVALSSSVGAETPTFRGHILRFE